MTGSLNIRRQCDALELVNGRAANSVPLVFFDPQYRSVLEKMKYGNEGKGARLNDRVSLQQMPDAYIRAVVEAIRDVLAPSGHLMLWVDKFLLCTGAHLKFTERVDLELVDMLTWDKDRMGMGYRSRRYSEHLLVFQKPPKRARGVWSRRDIPDVWAEKVDGARSGAHPHAKPLGLLKALIEATTVPGQLVLDPAAGSFVVERACVELGRPSLCGDIAGV